MPKQSLGFVSLAPRGDWDANTTYKRLDTVNYGGSSYIVLKALTGVTPVGDNINYMLLASKGDNAFQVWLLQPGNEGKTYEDYEAWLRQPATDAGERADEAAGKAEAAANNANSAATAAQGAAQNANAAAEEARTNAASAKNEADAAREATTNANSAATVAQGAAQNANTAADKANEAAGTIDDKIGGIQTELDKKADKTEIPTSLPANGGNADTLGGLDKMSFGRVFYPIDVDDTKGFVSAGYTPESGGTRPGPGTYGSILQVSNNIQGPAGGDWVFQIAHAHGEDRPYWRTQFNRKGWTEWKRLAFVDDLSGTLKNSGEQTLSNGRFNILVSTPEHVLMFKDAAGNIGYIGFGAFPTKDLQIMNYATGKYISISADGKLYYDNKELAFKSDIGSGGDNWYPTVMNWTDGSVQGPRLNLSGVGMTALSATIPIAGVSVSGVVTTTDQVFAGRKSFAAGIDIIAGGMAVDGGIVVTNGTISCNGEMSAVNGFYETSDVRLKKNIVQIRLLDKRIRLYEFDKCGRHSYGVIAQEVEKLYPTTVKEDNGRKVVNYTEILIIKCAEQDARIEVLEKENQELKDRLERLEKLLLK